MTRALPILVATLCVACAGGGEPPAEGSTAPLVEPEAVVDEGPPGASAIASLLQARHARDLPDEATLRAHEEPAAALRWLSSNHRRMVVRARALSSLRFFHDDATRAHLLGVLRSDAHPMLLAAAATGTERLVLDEPLREALEGTRAGGDPRVERAVASRLGRSRTRSAGPEGSTAGSLGARSSRSEL